MTTSLTERLRASPTSAIMLEAAPTPPADEQPQQDAPTPEEEEAWRQLEKDNG